MPVKYVKRVGGVAKNKMTMEEMVLEDMVREEPPRTKSAGLVSAPKSSQICAQMNVLRSLLTCTSSSRKW